MTHEQTNVQKRDYVGWREGTKVVGQNQGKKPPGAHSRPKKPWQFSYFPTTFSSVDAIQKLKF